MIRGYSIFLAISMALGSASLAAQNIKSNECTPHALSFADCLNRYEREIGLPDGDPVEPLTRIATHYFLAQQYQEADKALSLAREAVRVEEGLFTRSQIPLLIMQVENLSNSADWVEARKLQNHLIWLFQSKFTVPDESMIGELSAMSRLHMRGVGLDEETYRVHHFIRALYSNRLAISIANDIWPANDTRKVELIHEQLRMLHMRASHAMDKGLPLPASANVGRFPGKLVLNLSEKLTLGDMQRAGDRYLEQLLQLVDGNSSEPLEKRGIVKLYEANWLLLFDRNAETAEVYDESRSLLEQAGIPRESIDELMAQPLQWPGIGYHASVEGILGARSSRADISGSTPEAVSTASMKLRPFADMVLDGIVDKSTGYFSPAVGTSLSGE